MDMLLMLEDNAERIERFTTMLRLVDPALEMRVWRNAWTMLREVEPLRPAARLLCLDHDLDPEEGSSEDPGTGWEVTQRLASLPPACPVIIHTSNGERGTWMEGEFDLGGWKYSRISPLGDDWIEQDWRRLVRRLLKRRQG
jgi:CheY-like chemotaxis protein